MAHGFCQRHYMRLRRSGDPNRINTAGRPKNEHVEQFIRRNHHSRTVAFKYAKAIESIALVCRKGGNAELAGAIVDRADEASRRSTGRPNVEMFVRIAKLFVGFVAYHDDPATMETMALAIDRAADPHVLE